MSRGWRILADSGGIPKTEIGPLEEETAAVQTSTLVGFSRKNRQCDTAGIPGRGQWLSEAKKAS
jgi:hypothetical protein